MLLAILISLHVPVGGPVGFRAGSATNIETRLSYKLRLQIDVNQYLDRNRVRIMLGVGLVEIACSICLQCFDTVGWVAGRASGL